MNHPAASCEVSHYRHFIEASFKEYNPKRFNRSIFQRSEHRTKSNWSWERPGSLQHRSIIGVRLKVEVPAARFNAAFQLWNIQKVKWFNV
jgi:hypothetical protein